MRFLKMMAISTFSLALSAFPRVSSAQQSQAANTEADSVAITKTCADFSENFTHHDAHGVAMTFANDADFTNMRGNHSHGRKDIETWFAGLFNGNLRDSVRTDTVRSIRYFSPELASVDLDTVITGTKAADGSEIPARKGLMIVLMAKQNGHWYIGTFHESEYPAARPAASGNSVK
ncbi:MAG TPA: SgcJ/EcaC family oxidoreductase [Candidatus Acidoferrales bacterium]|nr:SgcJ/EcaC family oxidoreductase [Candidatus Acidoferrales bacterium]